MTFYPRPTEWQAFAKGKPAKRPGGVHGQHYFAFLSYSHRDEKSAAWLHDELEKFKVPAYLVGQMTEHGPVPRRLTPIFRDTRELAAADDLGCEIRAAITASRYLIVLCSPDARNSRWTNDEIEAFKRARPHGCIFAAILSGEPFASEIPGREAEECFPPALRFHYDRRGRRTAKRAEPLAADLRGGPDERRLGFLKLVAGMLGLGLDDLVQRDALRRQRRAAMITGGSLTGMLIASGLAVTAIQARNAASEQRQEAEGLVAFMLGDLTEKLQPIGKLEALDGVGARVLDYYSNQDTSDLTDEALLQRARALGLSGQVAYLRGDIESAERLYRKAHSGTAEAVSRDPDDTQRLFDHAQNVFWLGELARQRGSMGPAQAAFSEYRQLADRMVELEPDNLKWRMEGLYAKVNMGIVLNAQRRFAAAAQMFEDARGPMESLASIDPGNAVYQDELANTYAWLADARRDEGRIDAAIRLRERHIDHLRRQLQRGPNVSFSKQLILANQALGILLVAKGETAKGIGHLRTALAEAERLIPIETDNAQWKSYAAGAHLELAETMLDLGRVDEGAVQTRAGCRLTMEIRARDSSVAMWQGHWTECHKRRAQLALGKGDVNAAMALAQRAMESARNERSGDPVRDRFAIASVHRLVGDARNRAGDRDGARKAWAKGLSTIPSGVPERPLETVERIQLLDRLGRRDEAKTLADRLVAYGMKRV